MGRIPIIGKTGRIKGIGVKKPFENKKDLLGLVPNGNGSEELTGNQ